MALHFASLNSGSNANCYYIGNQHEAVLIDAGLSCRETENRMKRIGLSLRTVKAIFISHEHNDHIAGLSVLSKKYRLPVYITAPTLKNSQLNIDRELVKNFLEETPIQLSELTVTPFKKSHDAADPHSFTVEIPGITVGIITDIGYACRRVKKHFKRCDAVFLESNYSDEMLTQGSYPASLKKRIKGRKGHLSNDQALELFLKNKTERLRVLILSHLSQNNNRPDIVEETFRDHAGNVQVVIASRHRESELFRIEKSRVVMMQEKKSRMLKNQSQLSLFE